MVPCEFSQIPQSRFDSFQLQNLGINFKDTIYTNLLPQKNKKKFTAKSGNLNNISGFIQEGVG